MEIFNRYKKRNRSHHLSGDMEVFDKSTKKLGDILNSDIKTEDNVIYIHIPFCPKICTFCNMRRSLADPYKEYVDLLKKNIELYGKTNFGKNTTIDSIYFGGGTPTTLSTEELVEVLKSLKNNFNIKADAEISSETTLTEMTPEKLEALMEAGLNRISVGVQTFNNRGREMFNRIGTGEFAIKRLKEYKDLGFPNINIDLIYDFPTQTLDELKEDMEIISDLDISGFSMYSLILMGNTILSKKVGKNKDEREDLIRDFKYFSTVVEEGEKSGFKFLELTKMTKPGRDDYRYIINRHNNKFTFPIGSGAGGTILNCGVMNPLKKNEYEDFLENFYDKKVMCTENSYYDIKKAVSRSQFGEIDLSYLKDYQIPVIEKFIDELLEDKLIEKTEDPDVYNFTHLGKFWGNNINIEYLELLIKTERKYKNR